AIQLVGHIGAAHGHRCYLFVRFPSGGGGQRLDPRLWNRESGRPPWANTGLESQRCDDLRKSVAPPEVPAAYDSLAHKERHVFVAEWSFFDAVGRRRDAWWFHGAE